MNYVDGFIVAVPTAKRAEYEAYARNAAAMFKEHGALRVVECWGDDVPEGKLTSFGLAVKREADEVVVFSWLEWPDKASRDAGWERLMKDPRMDPKNNPMPCDGKRLIYGGFAGLVDL